MLNRVRGLFAKAESTQFPEEAEALSAKAQELMSWRALERATLDAEEHTPQSATSRRMWLDNPYVGAKSLVHIVASANRCRAVNYEKLGFVALLGDEMDLEITELLAYAARIGERLRTVTVVSEADDRLLPVRRAVRDDVPGHGQEVVLGEQRGGMGAPDVLPPTAPTWDWIAPSCRKAPEGSRVARV